MTMTDRDVADHHSAGSLADELPYWGWLPDDRTCLTRRGELVTLARLTPTVVDGHTLEQLDAVLNRWQRMLSGIDSRTRVYFYLLRRPATFPQADTADPLPSRLSAYRRPQPDPRECPRAGRHAPDRAQEPRHLRPLQHHPRAGTARRRGPTRRVSRATGAGGASPAAAPHGQRRRPAPRLAPPPRATRHRVRAAGGGGGRTPPACSPRLAHRPTGTNRPAIVAHVATGRADAAEHRHVPGTASGIARNSGATRDHRLSRHPWLAPL